MKKTIILLGIMFITSIGFSQGQKSKAQEKLQAARIALITERLGLTPEQAQQFWPVYNEYAEQRRTLHQEFKQARQAYDLQNMTEEQGRELRRIGLDTKQKTLNLEREYGDRLNKVVSARQLMALKKAEEDFRSMIIRRLEQRKRQQDQQQQMLRDREKKVQQGNN